MRRCTRCQVDVPGDSTICRRCGAIFPEVGDPPEVGEPPEVGAPPEVEGAATAESVDSPAPVSTIDGPERGDRFDELDLASDQTSAGPWDCPSCAEPVDAGFQVCWSCGTDRDGVVDPGFAQVSVRLDSSAQPSAVRAPGVPPPLPSARAPFGLPCPRCGSGRVIPHVHLGPPHSGDDLRIALSRPSGERFAPQPRSDGIRAEICAACGHVELEARDPKGLLADYLAQFE